LNDVDLDAALKDFQENRSVSVEKGKRAFVIGSAKRGPRPVFHLVEKRLLKFFKRMQVCDVLPV
jgi:hypothetical protein